MTAEMTFPPAHGSLGCACMQVFPPNVHVVGARRLHHASVPQGEHKALRERPACRSPQPDLLACLLCFVRIQIGRIDETTTKSYNTDEWGKRYIPCNKNELTQVGPSVVAFVDPFRLALPAESASQRVLSRSARALLPLSVTAPRRCRPSRLKYTSTGSRRTRPPTSSADGPRPDLTMSLLLLAARDVSVRCGAVRVRAEVW